MKRGLLVAAVLAAFGVSVAVRADSGATTLPDYTHAPANAREALDEVMPQVNMDGVTLGRAMDFFRSASGANLIVDWQTLEAAGVSKDAQITLQVHDLPLRKLLELALNQASPNTQLVFTAEQNIIEVTTQDEADRHLVTRTYSVADLMVPEVTQTPPKLDLSQASQQSSGGGGGGNLFADNSANGQANMTPQQLGDQLATIVKTIVRPTIWRENGGNASIQYFMGELVVTAPQSVQEAIGGDSPETSGERFGF